MIKIKLSTPSPELSVLRQTPSSKGVWGNCQFFLNTNIKECDFWVIYEGLSKMESVRCPQRNTVFITAEPPSIKEYEQEFLEQFTTVITSHRKIRHRNIVYTQQGYPWHIGRRVSNDDGMQITKDYDKLKAIKRFKKNRTLSVISSNKDFTEGHKKRLEFVMRLKEHFGSHIDVFGRGIREIGDKWGAIADYKYHVVLENSSYMDYWTEKLADAFLGGAYPFYFGCPNLADYFPRGSYTAINIDNFNDCSTTIENTIKNKQYERSIKERCEARKLILEKYNLFPMIAEFCNKSRLVNNKAKVTIKPEDTFTAKHRLRDSIRRFVNRLTGDETEL